MKRLLDYLAAVTQPSDLEKIRVGDLVDITYSEALAVGVRPEVKK